MIPKFRAWDVHNKEMFTNAQLIIWNGNVYANDPGKISVDKMRGWSIDEKYLMQSTGLFDVNGMAETLDRSKAAVKDKIKEYHLKDGTHNGRWTNAEIQYLINNYMFLKIKDMADYLGRTYSGVSTKARALGLRQINKKRLNREKVSELAAKGYTYKEIAQKLGSTHQNVITYCCKRGIKVRKMSMSERDLSEWRCLNSLDNSKVMFLK